MFIINFSFFLIVLKIFLLIILNLNNYIVYKLKNYSIYYFIYDIIISILVLMINFIYIKNVIVQNLLLNISVIALILQSYVFLYIVYFIIKEPEKINLLYKKLFYYNIITLFSKIILNILYHYNNTIFNFKWVALSSKYNIFFIINILYHLIFQYNIQMRCFIDFYIYIKNYKINSKLKHSYSLFFYTFFIKTIIYDYLIIFFDIFTYLNSHNCFFYSPQIYNIYNILYIILFISLINYFAIFFIIITAKKETNLILNSHIELNYSINISAFDSFKIISHEISFYDFLLTIIKKNINTQLKITDQMSMIILNNEFYQDLFHDNNIIYKEILKNKIVSYDYYYNTYNAYLLVKNNFISSEVENKMNQIILELEKYNIRLIIPFYTNNILSGYLAISHHSLNLKKNLTQSDINNMYNLSDYVTFCYKKLNNNIFYNQLNFQKKISEYNLIENNYKYDIIYKKLNSQISEIKQILIYENNKKICKTFTNIIDNEAIEAITDIHKNEPITQSHILKPKYYFIENQKNVFAILASGKIILHKHYASFYTVLPFIRKEYGLLYNLYYHERIDSIFPHNDQYLEDDRLFFSSFDNNFNIKIIMINIQSHSFFKMLHYFAQNFGFECIYISCEDLNENNFQKILDYYNYMLEENKKYYIIFTHIEKEATIIFKYILERYIDYAFKSNNLSIKLFFIINNEDKLKYIPPEIIQLANYNTIKINNQKKIKQEALATIIKNYTTIILNKKFNEETIQSFIKNNFNEKFENIYQYIDLFEQNILLKIQKQTCNNENEYITQAIQLKKESLKNHILMEELLKIYQNNYTKIASILGVHKSTISRYFKNIKR